MCVFSPSACSLVPRLLRAQRARAQFNAGVEKRREKAPEKGSGKTRNEEIGNEK